MLKKILKIQHEVAFLAKNIVSLSFLLLLLFVCWFFFVWTKKWKKLVFDLLNLMIYFHVSLMYGDHLNHSLKKTIRWYSQNEYSIPSFLAKKSFGFYDNRGGWEIETERDDDWMNDVICKTIGPMRKMTLSIYLKAIVNHCD